MAQGDKKKAGYYFLSGMAYDTYSIIEEDFIRLTRVIPIEEQTLSYYSPRFGDILLRVGSSVDIFLRAWINCYLMDRDQEALKLRNKKFITIKDYHRVFYEKHLKDQRVYVRPLDKDTVPFAGWTGKSPPKWWTAYNNVKHDGFIRKDSAVLKHTLNGLAALFLLHWANGLSKAHLVDFLPEPCRVTVDRNANISQELRSPIDSKRYLFRKQIKGWQSLNGEID